MKPQSLLFVFAAFFGKLEAVSRHKFFLVDKAFNFSSNITFQGRETMFSWKDRFLQCT